MKAEQTFTTKAQRGRAATKGEQSFTTKRTKVTKVFVG